MIGHRGFPTRAPENTLSSFSKAIEVGVDMIEFDVTLTKDGIPIVLHDRSVNRTTNGKGRARKLTYAAIRMLDAGTWFSKEFVGERIPTLEETLDLVQGKVALNIEIKKEAIRSNPQGGIEQKTIDALEKRNLVHQTVISSFAPKAIQRIKQLQIQQPTALLLPRIPRRDPRPLLDRLNADALHVPVRGLRVKFVEKIQREGIPLRVFTVNQIPVMKRLMQWKVDGIFTDYPDRFLEWLGQNI